MEQEFLRGEHDLTIDEKGRILIPAEFRRAFESNKEGPKFVLVIGLDARLWVYPERAYNELVTRRQQDATPSFDRLDFEDIYFGMASPVEIDKQGRILVPEKMLRRANLDREVTVRGAGTYLKIWDRADWEARQQTLLQKQRAEYAARTGLTGLPDVGEVSRPSG